MPLNMKVLVRRHMKHTSGWHADGKLPPGTVLDGGEVLIGWYSNHEEENGPTLTFSDKGIHIGSVANEPQFVSYESITDYQTPPRKFDLDGILVTTAGRELLIPISGHWSFKKSDAFALVMVFYMLLFVRSRNRMPCP